MKKFLGAILVALGLTVGPASAVTLDLTLGAGVLNTANPGTSTTVTDAGGSGINLTLTAFNPSILATSADLNVNGSGVGVVTQFIPPFVDGSGTIDGRGGDEFVFLTFSESVFLQGLTFGSAGANDEYDLVVDGSFAFFNDETSSPNAFAGGNSFTGSVFGIRANQNNDDFRLASVTFAAVPLPVPFLLLGSAVGGLILLRRKKANA